MGRLAFKITLINGKLSIQSRVAFLDLILSFFDLHSLIFLFFLYCACLSVWRACFPGVLAGGGPCFCWRTFRSRMSSLNPLLSAVSATQWLTERKLYKVYCDELLTSSDVVSLFKLRAKAPLTIRLDSFPICHQIFQHLQHKLAQNLVQISVVPGRCIDGSKSFLHCPHDVDNLALCPGNYWIDCFGF